MKIMISQPMRGLTEEQIRKNREEAIKRIEAAGDTVVDTIVAHTPPEGNDQALWYLGESLKMMSGCDGVYFLRGWDNARGCLIEHAAALAYGLWIKEEN